ncbi:MAG TPA: mechanosensitive ion channel family protein [Candidatus Humimicrobiaceae bacterium]|nr:mechanosensitive ion channel family protein [Candidatus Humimicrobiaceae bacterium]
MADLLQNLTPWFLSSGVKILAILAAAFLITRFAVKIIERAITKEIKIKDRTKDGAVRRQKTLIGIFNGALRVFVWLVVAMMVLSELGLNIGPILAGAGLLGVALGFGAQWMVRDFLAGMFIILENQYRVGDVVCLDDTCGFVEDITLRKTVMRDLDGKEIHIPNGSFKMAANLTHGYSRAHMDIAVAYKEDLDKVIKVINKVGSQMAQEEPWKEYILKPIQVLGSGPDSFGDSAVIIKVLGETQPLRQWDTLREFRRRLKKTFDKEKIEIPFPQMSIWSRSKPRK